MRMPSRLFATAAGAVAITIGITACGSGSSDSAGSSAANGEVSVVASTDVYGAIAQAVAGDHASVKSLFSNPTGDPHEFEPSAQDTLAIKQAGVLVYNGGHYDEYMEKAADGASGTKVDATDLQDPKGENEHLFYDLSTMKKVAESVAKALGEKDSAHRADYDSKSKEFGVKIDAVIAKAKEIGAKSPGAKVAATEPVAGYLLQTAGLTDATPSAFTDAIESGTDPAPAVIASATALLTGKQVRAVVLNAQTESPVTSSFAKTAEASGIPVVRITETLPQGVTDYVTWQSDNVTSLAAALARA